MASLTGTVVSYTPEVENGLLHYRALKSCKNKALSRNRLNFYENMTLTSGDLVDIQWLIDNVRHEFTQLIKMGPQVNVSTDVFALGGGGGEHLAETLKLGDHWI